MFHIRESYVIKSQSHDPDNTKQMEALSGENTDEYFKAMNDEIQSVMRSEPWQIVSSKSVSDHNVIPGTLSFKCKRKPDRQEIQGTILCKRGYLEQIVS